MGATTLVCHSSRTALDVHILLQRRVNQDIPTTPIALKELGGIASTLGAPLTHSCVTTSATSTTEIKCHPLQYPKAASCTEYVLVGLNIPSTAEKKPQLRLSFYLGSCYYCETLCSLLVVGSLCSPI